MYAVYYRPEIRSHLVSWVVSSTMSWLTPKTIFLKENTHLVHKWQGNILIVYITEIVETRNFKMCYLVFTSESVGI